MKRIVTLSLSAMLLSGCASPKVAWDTLEKNIDDTQYCKKAFTDSEDIADCNIEMAARKRAKKVCAQAKYVERCEINASYSWDALKFNLDNQLDAKPTMTAAETYPIICNYGNGIRKPCKEDFTSK